MDCCSATTRTITDIICWDKLSIRTAMVELTICFDTLFKQAAKRKRKKYFDLCENCNHDALLITLEVGSRSDPFARFPPDAEASRLL